MFSLKIYGLQESHFFRNLLDEGEARRSLDLPTFGRCTPFFCLQITYWSSHRFCSLAKWLIQHRCFSYGDPHLCIGSHHTYISTETRWWSPERWRGSEGCGLEVKVVNLEKGIPLFLYEIPNSFIYNYVKYYIIYHDDSIIIIHHF